MQYAMARLTIMFDGEFVGSRARIEPAQNKESTGPKSSRSSSAATKKERVGQMPVSGKVFFIIFVDDRGGMFPHIPLS